MTIQLCHNMNELAYILKDIQIENRYFELLLYFTALLFYCILDQIKTALVSIKYLQNF